MNDNNKKFAGSDFLNFNSKDNAKEISNDNANENQNIKSNENQNESKNTGIDFLRNTINGVNIDSLFGESAEIKNGSVIKNQSTEKENFNKNTQGDNAKPTDPILPKISTNNSTNNTYPKEKLNTEKKHPNYIVILSVVLALIVGIGGGLGGAYLYNNFYAPSSTYNINPSRDYSYAEAVAEKSGSSVVGIVASKQVDVQSFFGQTEKQEQSGLGTGFIVDSSGYILTNSHVVLDGQAQSIKVVFPDDTKIDGKLVYNDTAVDLAIIKINKAGLTPVTLGNSSSINIGSLVVAIGNPEALDYYGTVTQGIVSGLHRNISIADATGKSKVMEDLIQVDAAINGGNSGGPLFNAKGEVIGINTAKAGTSTSGNSLEGMGFAIPIDLAKPIIKKIKSSGKYERPMIGISTLELNEAVANGNIEPSSNGVKSGLYVIKVEKKSPGEKAGIKAGDVIVKIGNKDVVHNGDIVSYLLDKEFGQKIAITYYRGQSKQTTNLVLDKNYKNS